MPYVYLVQPCVLKGTNRYKIGMSALTDLSRVRSYKKGTRYLYIGECVDAFQVEKVLIAKFKSRYRCIAGKEYFEVDDELDMLNLFVGTVMAHKNKGRSPPTPPTPTSPTPTSDWMARFAFKSS